MSEARLFRTQYGATPVVELAYRGVSVLRRLSGDMTINATQIITLSGITDRAKRLRIIEEKCRKLAWPHEKVQGGAAPVQGTWVHPDNALKLATEFKVDHIVKPLLDVDVDSLPASETASSTGGKRKASAAGLVANQRSPRIPTRATRGSAAGSSANINPSLSIDDEEQDDIEDFSLDGSSSANSVNLPNQTGNGGTSRGATFPAQGRLGPTSRKNTSDSTFASTQAFLVSLFVATPDSAQIDSIPPELDVLTPIDGRGNTALHWAASLGHTETLSKLIAALPATSPTAGLILNHVNETPLMSAMKLANNHARGSFAAVLDRLGTQPGIFSARDTRGQTCFHYAAVLAATRGRGGVDACAAYLRAVLDAIKEDKEPSLVDALNARDWNGDRAVDVVRKRVQGCEAILKAFEELGADVSGAESFMTSKVDVMARIQKAVEDVSSGPGSGAAMEVDDAQAKHDATVKEAITKIPKITEGNPEFVRKSNETQTAALALLQQLSATYNEALRAKAQAIKDKQTEIELRELEVSVLRKQNKDLRAQNVTIGEVAHRIGILERSLAQEQEKSRLRREAEAKGPATPMVPVTFAGNDLESLKAEEVRLRSLIEEKRTVKEMLQAEKMKLRAKGDEKYSESVMNMRRVIAYSLSLPMDQIDDFLDPFLVAMEAGPPKGP
ncbi:hypothetical protein BC830DRAFT_1095628 [Chytriomyces sp. MP71]|nr:hypothetical protein BC830DRAFT_1095628 [Chytriomyces sp. MP71]